MAVLVVLIALALLIAVVLVIAAPLRASRESQSTPSAPDADRQELEAQREAKYREIRDAELDFRTGKLSPEDHAAIDAALRSEALGILNRLERRGGEVSAGEGPAGGSGTDEATPRGA